jgi:hypothetical protein
MLEMLWRCSSYKSSFFLDILVSEICKVIKNTAPVLGQYPLFDHKEDDLSGEKVNEG